jgi:hypothetical protein
VKSGIKSLIKKVKALFKGKDDKDKKDDKGDGAVGEKVPFSAGGESHSLWVEVSGASAVLMVASNPSTIETFLTSSPVTNFAKKSSENKALVGGALGIAQTSKVDAQKALEYMRADDKSEEFKAMDDALEGKEKTLMQSLKQIFDQLGGDEKIAAAKKLLSEHMSSLERRVEKTRKALNGLADKKKKDDLGKWIPSTLDAVVHELTSAKKFLEEATDKEGVDLVQATVKEQEAALVRAETEVGVKDAHDDGEGSSLKRFKGIVQKGLTHVAHDNKHMRGPVAGRQNMAIQSGAGQYKGSHGAVIGMEKQVIASALSGAGDLRDLKSMFYIFAPMGGVGFVGATGAENSTVRVEVTDSGVVHSHPR